MPRKDGTLFTYEKLAQASLRRREANKELLAAAKMALRNIEWMMERGQWPTKVEAEALRSAIAKVEAR